MSTYCNYWNKVSLVKSKIKQSKKIDSIGIGLASPEEIRRWGERRLPNGTLIGKVDKDHTVDYESLKPIEGGLFCERIFGPVEDFYCSCDRKGEKNEKFCPNCEVEFTKSRVRRVRMGYIPLAVPVVHVWYLRGRPSYIANLVGKNRNSIDRLAYGETLCESFIGFSSLKSIDKKESFTNVRSSEDVTLTSLTSFPSFGREAKLTSASRPFRRKEEMSAKQMLFLPSERTRSKKEGKQRLCLTPNPSAKMNLLGGHWGAGYTKGLMTSNKPLCIQRGFALPSEAKDVNRIKASVGVKAVEGIAKQDYRLLRNVTSRVKQTGSISLMASQKCPIPPAFSVTSQSTSNFLRCSYYNPLTSYASPTEVSTASLKGLVSYSLPRYLCAKLKRGREALHSFGRKTSKEEVRAFIPVLQRIVSLTSLPYKAKDTKQMLFLPSERTPLCLWNKARGRSKKKKNGGNKLTPLTKWFFSHTVVASTGSMKNIYRSCLASPRSMSFFIVPMQKGIGKVESIKQTYFTKPVVVSNRNKISFLSRKGFRRYSKKRNTSYVHPLVLFHTQEAARGVPFTGPITSNELSTTLLTSLSCKAKGTKSAKQMLFLPSERTPLCLWNKARGRSKKGVSLSFGYEVSKPYKSFARPIDAKGLHKATTASIINNDSFISLGMLTESVAVYPERLTKQHPFGVRESIAEKQGFTDPTPPPYKNQIFEQKQKYLKFHTLPLFSTFVYKEWSHRFSFLEYFIWSARNNDLVLPFYAHHNSRSEKSRANLCESIRKNSLNLIKNKFSLRFSNKSNLSLNAAVYVPSSALHNISVASQGQDVRGKGNICFAYAKQISSFLAKLRVRSQQSKGHPFAYEIKLGLAKLTSSMLEADVNFALLTSYPKEGKDVTLPSDTKFSFADGVSETRRNAYLNYYNPLTSYASLTKVSTVRPFWAFTGLIPSPSTESLVSKKQLEGFAFLRHPKWGIEGKQMDTQQFPRLTELLNFTGGAALRNLLSRFDLVVLSKFLRHELKNVELKVNNLLALKMLTYSQGLLLGKLAKRRSKQIRRLKLLELFQSQKSNPEWMILSVIPVLPPDLRPILRVNDDFVVASDLNRLYQTVLRRNNTIHERLDDPLPCPESGLFRQRSLQKAVDGLLENGKGGGTPLCASKRRPLVSLSHVLKGKKGLFRQHLLGKRVDYSGRSVIVVGPRLQLHECGLPKEMAIELFQPFLLHRLKIKGIATSNTAARRMIQQGDPVIWHILKQLVYEHPVLLNRAPTLHRLGIQAFQPRLVSGRAILLHPLVCNGFNADFDGDQMAVHVPLSFQARAEAWKIMWSKNNFLSPATGQPILVPSQDMVLGCYYLSVSIPRILNVIPVQRKASDLKNVQKKEGFTNVRSLEDVTLAKRKVVQSEGEVKQNRAFTSTDCFASAKQIFSLQSKEHPKGVEADVIPCKAKLTSASLTSPMLVRSKKEEMLAKQEGGLPRQTLSKEFIDKVGRLPVMARGIQDAAKRETFGLLHTNNKFPASYLLQKHSLASQGILSEITESVTSITCNRPSQRQSTFLNENKGHYFSNLQDSLLAYFQGRLQTHTPFWVRIDPVSFHPITPLLTTNAQLLPSNTKFSFTKSKFTCGPKPQLCKTLYSRFAYRARLEKAFTPAITNTSASVLQPLYGSSREMCKTLFQNKSANHFQIRVEANETLESPLELRLSIDGNLANILTMFQNHYNYNATWVKQCKEESIKYMRTTAGRVVINEAVFKNF